MLDPALPTVTPLEMCGFVCDQSGPEDLVAVPGSPWVLASSYPEGSGGIRLIDTRDLTTTVLAPTAAVLEQHDRGIYGACPGPIVSVEKENFSTHGLYLDAGTGGVHTVYATHHGTRESVEVFELDVDGQTPVLTWIGCAVAPETVSLNSVVALPDGGFAATSFRDLDAPIEPLMTGEISGAIWAWHTDTGMADGPGERDVRAKRDRDFARWPMVLRGRVGHAVRRPVVTGDDACPAG